MVSARREASWTIREVKIPRRIERAIEITAVTRTGTRSSVEPPAPHNLVAVVDATAAIVVTTAAGWDNMTHRCGNSTKKSNHASVFGSSTWMAISADQATAR